MKTQTCKCKECDILFEKPLNEYKRSIKLNRDIFCSRTCHGKYLKTGTIVSCKQCGQQIYRAKQVIQKSRHSFCSRSCNITYNNKHKKYGTRRSKLEVYLEEKLVNLYPDLDIHFNRKDTIGSELDIYIPSLNLAFELNGIFHYEPIYGKDKLGKIQNNDISKSKACHDSKIDLCIIDTSQQKKFTYKSSIPYLTIIIDIINNSLLQS